MYKEAYFPLYTDNMDKIYKRINGNIEKTENITQKHRIYTLKKCHTLLK